MRLSATALVLLLAFVPLSQVDAQDPGCRELRASALVSPAVALEGACSGIRPGAAIATSAGSCTMAWILRDANGALYGSTAGHCGVVGQRVRVGGQAIGTMVYAVDQPIGEDFGVFSIDADKAHLVDPDMCAWGGATGVWTEEGPVATGLVRHFGFGVGTGTLAQTRARSGVLDHASATTFAFVGAVAPGDSGSPARASSGEALGVITDLLSPRSPGTGPLVPEDPVLLTQLGIGTRLDHGLARVEAATGLSLSLVTGEPRNELA